MALLRLPVILFGGVAYLGALIWVGLQIRRAARDARSGNQNAAAEAILSALQLFGMILLAVGLLFAVSTVQFKSTAQKTPGQIVAFEHRRSSDGDDLLAPVFAFTNQAGSRYEVISSIASSSQSYDVGAIVPVLYQPIDPEAARLDTFKHNWLFASIFSCGGLLMFGLATTIRITRRGNTSFFKEQTVPGRA